MFFKNRFASATSIILLASLPCFSHSQSLSDLLKLVPKNTSSKNIFDTIQSISETSFGQIEPGNEPENANEKLILYRTAWCPICKRAALYMRKRNVGFVERDIEANSNYKAEFSRLGGRGVPFIVLREKTMSGFDETKFEQYYAEFKKSLETATNLSTTGDSSLTSSSNSPAFQSGDVLIGKISGISIYLQPAKSEKLAVLGKSDEMIYMGELRNGFYRVTTQKGEGWVEKLLVKKQ